MEVGGGAHDDEVLAIAMSATVEGVTGKRGGKGKMDMALSIICKE